MLNLWVIKSTTERLPMSKSRMNRNKFHFRGMGREGRSPRFFAGALGLILIAVLVTFGFNPYNPSMHLGDSYRGRENSYTPALPLLNKVLDFGWGPLARGLVRASESMISQRLQG